MGDFQPLGADPTPGELGDGISAVHRCLEEHKAESAERHVSLEKKLDASVAMLMQGLTNVGQAQTVMMTAFGVQHQEDGQPAPVRTVAALTPWQLGWRLAVGVLPVLGLWQWGGKLWPVIWPAVRAINHAVTGN